MKIISAEFITSAVSQKQYPKTRFPELAFVGRSNVGKSSLINSLVNRKKLVKTSSTPGKTQLINFFIINEKLVFADLPGYGFARVPATVKKQWQRMIEQYLQTRDQLATVVFIVDIRRNPTPLDLDLQRWLDSGGIDYILVATKADKLSKAECNRQLVKIREAFFAEGEGELIAYSSKTGRGRKELWKVILQRAEALRMEEA